MIRKRLLRLFTPERRRYTFVGMGMAGVNALLLVFLVSVCGANPLYANMGRTVVTTQISFLIHRRYTWRQTGQDPWRQWRRYQAFKAGSIVSRQVLFVLLLTVFGIHYILAYVITSIGSSMVKFGALQRFVFGSTE